MSKIDVTRTELVWPGKYDDDGNLVTPRRVNLPFQVIERVNETRATREERKEQLSGHVGTLFDYWQAEEEQMADDGDGWRNKLIWGDNLYVMGSLLEHFAGKVDLIYIDPPFATGADFSFTAQIGDGGVDATKEQSIIEEKAYRDTWSKGLDSYLQVLYQRLVLLRELLSDSGSFYIHLDRHVAHYVKCALDEIFGSRNFRNELVWKRTAARSDSHTYNHIHDVIFVYTKGDTYTFNVQHTPYDEDYINKFYRYKEETGRRFMPDNLMAAGTREGSSGQPWRGIDPRSRGNHWKYTIEKLEQLDQEGRIYWPPSGGVPRYKRYLDEMPGVALQSIWTDISTISWQAAENVGYDTQKPEPLLERIIKCSSNENDLVADFFCGSGTTLAVAEKLGRRWIGGDLSRYAIHVTRKRMMDIPECSPFEVLNLGKYERQVWQGVTFGSKKQPQDMLIFEYLKFILELYGAQPLAGMQHLHGKKGSAVVHVGAVDAPVTIDEILNCLEECQTADQKELHILGWEWEMGLNSLMTDEAKKMGIKLLMLHIPREVMEQQAVEKGDIHFYELAYLETDIQVQDRTVTIELTDFVIPNTELVPPDVREKITKWSDYVDYWAIDWDFQNDTFVNGWTSYRTRQDRTLQLKTDPHAYEDPGTYRIVVKAIDIFGNDTTQAFEVEVT